MFRFVRPPGGTAGNFTRTVSRLLDLLAPRECAACGSDSGCAPTFCAACGAARALSPDQLAGAPLAVAGAYEPPLSRAIGRFKFEGHPELAPSLARLLDDTLASLALRSSDVCVPVPLHARRRVERGYDQAALLAQSIARRAGIGFAPRLLERARATEQQARLGRDARTHNVGGAFRVRASLPAGRIVLVDDVVTTGATLAACIDALRAAGRNVVVSLALARAGRNLP